MAWGARVGAVLVALISDTHIPRRARGLPERCVERLRAADLIIHAGDLITSAVLTQLREYGDVAAVHGNADDAEVQQALPCEIGIDLCGRQVVVVHDAGPRIGRLPRLRRRYPEADAVIFGHSHIPVHETDAHGFQIFNPGSPTDRRRARNHTMGLVRPSGHGLAFELLALD
jgi:hypothetical protein